MTEFLTLIPLDKDLLAVLYQWFNSPVAAGAYDGITEESFENVQRRYDQGLYKNLRVVSLKSTPIGWTDIRIFPECSDSAALTVQISKPQYRGKGLGLKIHQLAIAEFLENNTDVTLIEAWTHVDNLAEQRILERLEFRRSGSMVQTFNGGESAEFYSYELNVL